MDKSPEELDDLIQTLAAGFGALLEETSCLSQREQDLSRRLSTLSQEYLKFSDTLPLPPSQNDESRAPWLEGLPAESKQVIQRGRDVYASIVKPTRKCPFKNQEMDFTTPGRQGSLQCPLAKGPLLTPNQSNPEHTDPIKAEFHHDRIASPPPSVTASAGKCPIRFLDQNSPEEVAQYFENHKHEIPRSHEICVKRYQSNEEGIRQLDAKYGNLVSMIQGLGAKHQAYLPEENHNVDRTSTERVEEWAEGVSIRSQHPEEEEDRTGHFERSLRDVRVGESPSRPWGIAVPLEEEETKSAIMFRADSPQQASNKLPTQVKGKCPFDHGITSSSKERAAVPDSTPKECPAQSTTTPKMVFTGPVFIGYSADDAARILQLTGAAFGSPKH